MKWKTLGEIFRISSGGTPQSSKREYYEIGTIPWVNTGDLKKRHLTINEIPKKITQLGLDNSSAKIFPVNTVLVAMYGASIGNAAILKAEAATNQACAALLPNEDFSEEFLYFYLLSIQKNLVSQGQGGGQPNISAEIIKRTKFPIVPLETQRQIVTVLDKAQSVIDKRKNSLQLLDQLLRDTFLDMFGDPEKNPKEFKIGSIRDLVTAVNYGTSERANDQGKYPYLRMNNITYDGYLDVHDLKYINADEKDLEKYGLKQGDLIFNRTNSKELVGKTAVYKRKEDVVIAGYLIRVRVNKSANADYISGYLNSSHGKMTLKNMCKNIIGMANINAQEFQSIKIAIPPIQLQNQYSKYLDEILIIREKLLSNLNELESLFQSLLQKAFKGELEFPMNVEEHIEKGLPLTRDLPVSKPLELKTESFSSLLQKTTENYNFLKERVESYAEEKPVQALQRIIENLLKRIGKIKTEAQLISLLEKNKLPGIQSLSDIKKIREWFEQYDVYSHEGGRFQLDIISAVRNNILSCREGLQQLLKENSFFLFSKQTMAFAQAIAKEVEQAVTKTEEEYEAEIIRYSGGDPASLFLDDKKDIDTITVAEAKLSLLQAIGENHVQNFGIQDLKTALEDELSFSGYNNKGLSYEEVRQGVYNFIDQFLISEFNNQPFTFFQLQQALAAIDFTPSFELLNDYIFDSLQTKHPLLKQAYFDEQMRNVNEEAYQYLLNTMDSRLMGPDTFTPPRRMFLIYGFPTVKISNAT